MKARVNQEYIPVVVAGKIEGVSIIEVACPDYEAYRCLPLTLEFEGKLHGRTGWNSDRGLACYKTNAMQALIV